MASTRIIAGSLKGRPIPFNPKAFGNAEITAGRVKEALFSILGDLHGKTFADFFAGSGQIAFEALSRGAKRILCCETDSDRFGFILKFAASLPESSKFILMNMPAQRAFRLAAKRGVCSDFIFLDPPYDKTKGETLIYGRLLEEIEKYGLAGNSGTVAIQHFAKNTLHEEYSAFRKITSRTYGTTSLTLYEKISDM